MEPDIAATTPPSDTVHEFGQGKAFDASLRRLGDMSFVQARIFLATNILEDLSTCNVAFSWKVEGQIDNARLQMALQPTQRVFETSKLFLEVIQVAEERSITEEFQKLRGHEFDIEEGDKIRGLVVSSPLSCNSMLCYHRIIMDSVSLGIVMKVLAETYVRPH